MFYFSMGTVSQSDGNDIELGFDHLLRRIKRRVVKRSYKLRKPEMHRRHNRKYRQTHQEKVKDIRRRSRKKRYAEGKRKPPHKVYWWSRKRKLRKSYGLSVGDYNAMLTKQRHSCAICHFRPAPHAIAGHEILCVDHDHKAENIKVRGLLCSRCNRFLGYIADDIGILQNMISYLQGN